MRIAGIVAAVTLSIVSPRARAEPSKAWTAAKAGLPADAKIVVGINLAALQKTELFAMLYPKLIEQADATKVIDTLKDTCKIDPLAAVQGLVVALSADQQDGAMYIAISGINRAKLSSCLSLAAQGMGDKNTKISVQQNGNITQVSDGKDTVFIGWAGKDVLIVPIHAEDRSSLLKWMGGKGGLAKSALGKRIAKVNTSATLWGAGEGDKEVQAGVNAKGGYGAATFSKGTLDVDAHAVMENAAQATTMANTVKQQIDDLKQAPQVPPAAVTMLQAVKVTTAKEEVVFKGSVIERDLLSMLALAMSGLGGI
jgi:hypothetical protein